MSHSIRVGVAPDGVDSQAAVETALPRRRASFGLNQVFGALAGNPHYRTYWYGNQAGTMVMQMQQVANGYLAYTLTDSATALGIVGLASAVPMFFFSPIGGVLADRLEKRKLLIILQLVQCLISLAIGVLSATGLIAYWHLVASAVVQGFCFATIMPTRQSWIPALVRREDLANAMALNNAGQNASRVIGPSIAGVLIAVPWFGVTGIYFLRLVAFIWILFTLLQIPIKGEPDPTDSHVRPSMYEQLTVGLRYIWQHETLLPLFTFALVTMLLGQSYQQLLPAFALGEFNVGAEGLGLMMTVVGIGALLGSLTMAYLSRNPNQAGLQAYTGTALGLALAVFGVSSAFQLFPVALVALFVVGLSLDFNATINNTLILLNADRAVYGRVSSVYMMTWSLSPMGAAMAGWSVDHVGGSLTMSSMGIVLATFVVLMATLHPGYKKIRGTAMA